MMIWISEHKNFDSYQGGRRFEATTIITVFTSIFLIPMNISLKRGIINMTKKMKYVSVIAMLFYIGFAIITTDMAYAANKNDYTERYNALERKCQKKFKYDGAQSEMNVDSHTEYKLWNKELNYIYKSVIKTLDDSEARKLKASEKKWKKQRKKKATEDAAVDEGGSLHPLEYNASMITQTKKRIKWLIKNYT